MKVILVACMVMLELRGITTVCYLKHSWPRTTAHSFKLWELLVLIDAIDMYANSHSQGTCVLLEIPSTHKLVQYFQSRHTCRNEDIYEFKGVHIANFEVYLCSSSVEYCSISNVNSLC